MKNPKDLKLVFAPGCFDNFEGTQEELNELIAEITAKFEDGTIFEESEEVDLDELDEDEIESIVVSATQERNLH